MRGENKFDAKIKAKKNDATHSFVWFFGVFFVIFLFDWLLAEKVLCYYY